jgi:hypothetical protein
MILISDEYFVVSVDETDVWKVMRMVYGLRGNYISLLVLGEFWRLSFLEIGMLAWNIFSFYEMVVEMLKLLFAVSYPLVAEAFLDDHSFFVVSLF